MQGIANKSKPDYDLNLTLVDLSTVEPEKIEWTWKPYFPVGKLVIIDGDGSVGKTTILLDIIARMTTNGVMPDGTRTEGGGAVYVLYEDGIADTIVPRLKKKNADLSRVQPIKDVVVWDGEEQVTRPFSLNEDIPLLRQAVRKVDARLVIIDPITSALGITTDSYKDQEVRKALNPLVSFAEEEQVTVVMVRHFTKQNAPNIQHRGIGSMAFINMSRVALAVLPDPDPDPDKEGVMHLLHTKHNLTKEAPPLDYRIKSDADEVVYVEWLGKSDKTAKQVVSPPTPPSRTKQDILSVLASSEVPLKTSEIAGQLVERGHKYATVRGTLARMVDEKMINSTTRGEYFLPPAS